MRYSLLLATSAVALMALPALAQEATTDPAATDQTATDQTATEGDTTATGGDATTTDTATGEPATTEEPTSSEDGAPSEEPAAEAEDGTVVTTTEDGATEAGSAEGGDPMQNLTMAAERLREVGEQMQNGGAVTIDETATGATGTAADTVTADSAAATTETEGQVSADMQQMQADATQALDDFDAALQQVSAEGDQAMQEQVAALQGQSEQVRQQLQEDPATAGEDMQTLADTALQLQTAAIPAEADAIMGRQVVTADGEEAGEIRDVLVTADGQVEAIIIERGGALGLGGTSIALTWDQVQLQGDQIVVNATRDEMEQMPEYQTE